MMASVFKRIRWADAKGRKCSKGSPGAHQIESRFWTIQIVENGRPKTFKGFMDKAASEQLASRLERDKARGEMGMLDVYKAHRQRPLAEHIADWITELRQLGRDDVYLGQCESRLVRMQKECGWALLGEISSSAFIRWREKATATVGTAAKVGTNVVPMGARTQNHYLEALGCFCRWAIKRKRMPSNPVADVTPVETVGKLRRERRALTPEELTELLSILKPRHLLVYSIILATGLRRDELRLLRWGDVKLNAPKPFIELRAETTKAKRADTLPLRSDLVSLLKAERGDAADDERVCPSSPSMETHRRYLAKAGIAYLDDRGRRADFHSLRHSYGTMLATSGVAPRIAMALMRHTDMRLTMNRYTDPRIFDMAGAVEKMPSLIAVPSTAISGHATGTDGAAMDSVGRSKSGSSQSALMGYSAAVMGKHSSTDKSSLTLVGDMERQQKTPSGTDGETERAKGFEPSTFSLEG